MTAAEKINEHLKNHGITKSFLSRKTGINRSALSEKLMGRVRLNSEDIQKICVALDRTPNDFIILPEGEDNETVFKN